MLYKRKACLFKICSKNPKIMKIGFQKPESQGALGRGTAGPDQTELEILVQKSKDSRNPRSLEILEIERFWKSWKSINSRNRGNPTRNPRNPGNLESQKSQTSRIQDVLEIRKFQRKLLL